MTTQTPGQNMMLITSYWQDKDTFKLMPITDDCPYMEAMYDPSTTLLVVLCKTTKENYHFVPKLDDNGRRIPIKNPQAGENPYKEQRVLMNLQHEFYLTDPAEQEEFIKMFAINAGTYDYKRFHRDMSKEPTLMKVESAPLVNEQGLPLTPSN